MKKILSLFFVAFFSMSVWADTSGTIYVTGANMFGGAWDYENSVIKYAYNYNPGDGWTDHMSMTDTEKTYHSYPVYSGTISSSTVNAKLFFYHYKNGSNVEEYKVENGAWFDFSGCLGKMYNGWHNSKHEWITIESDTYDVKETFTVYYVCNPGSYTLKANMRLSQDYNVWNKVTMTNTTKTYGGTPIYSVAVTTYRGGLLNLQFQRYDGDQHVDEVAPIDGSAWTENSVFEGKMWNGTAWIDYSDDTTPTAIDEAVEGKKAVKRIVNGQLVIEREGKMYNALGAEVK